MLNIIEGTFIGRGVECPQFRLDSGEQISLSGDVGDLSVGDHAVLRGRWMRISTCMQGRTFRVQEIGEVED